MDIRVGWVTIEQAMTEKFHQKLLLFELFYLLRKILCLHINWSMKTQKKCFWYFISLQTVSVCLSAFLLLNRFSSRCLHSYVSAVSRLRKKRARNVYVWNARSLSKWISESSFVQKSLDLRRLFLILFKWNF